MLAVEFCDLLRCRGSGLAGALLLCQDLLALLTLLLNTSLQLSFLFCQSLFFSLDSSQVLLKLLDLRSRRANLSLKLLLGGLNIRFCFTLEFSLLFELLLKLGLACLLGGK